MARFTFRAIGARLLFGAIGLLLVLACASPPNNGSNGTNGRVENGNGNDNGTENGNGNGKPHPPCEDELGYCEGSCVDTSSSLEHCGGCGVQCFSGQSCTDGNCIGAGALTPEALNEALEGKDFLLINVRVPSVGIIPGTDASSCNEQPDELAELIGPDPHARVVVYCRTNPRSLDAIWELRARGYTSVSYLEDGVEGWLEAGFDLE